MMCPPSRGAVDAETKSAYPQDIGAGLGLAGSSLSDPSVAFRARLVAIATGIDEAGSSRFTGGCGFVYRRVGAMKTRSRLEHRLWGCNN